MRPAQVATLSHAGEAGRSEGDAGDDPESRHIASGGATLAAACVAPPADRGGDRPDRRHRRRHVLPVAAKGSGTLRPTQSGQ